ncbi:MAG: hypothetical protein HC923_03080 [Myxococcales bacterium]|nr:hypothetical protein [Myxococcales bacterium]
MSNALRHASASHIALRLEEDGGMLRMTIEDDGTGVDGPPREHAGLGLRTMVHRARALGGSATIEPRPERGTRVRVEVPV